MRARFLTRYWSRLTGSGSGFNGAAALGTVRPVPIVVGLVLAENPPQMGMVPDEGSVQEFASAPSDPAFGDRNHSGRSEVAEYGPDCGIGEQRVEYGGEVRAAVADHELDSIHLLAEIDEKVACLLSGPRAGWMLRDAAQDRIGVTRSRSPWRHAFGITLGRVAGTARSAQSRFERRGCRRCCTASWRRRIEISAVFHASSRRDSRSHEVACVIKRKRRTAGT
jgi:hypothetical protein